MVGFVMEGHIYMQAEIRNLDSQAKVDLNRNKCGLKVEVIGKNATYNIGHQ